MTDRLQAYEVFAELMRRKNFSETSKVLGVPQPTISKHIASLEVTLGVQLFVRTTRRTVPTAEALDLLPLVRQMLDTNEEIRRKATGQRPEISGKLRVMAPAAYMRHVLLDRMILFRKSHPALEVELLTSPVPVDLGTAGVDLAVTDSAQTEGPNMQRVLARPNWHLLATPAYLDRNGRPTGPGDLEQRQVVLPFRQSDSILQFESEHGHEAIRVGAGIGCDDADLALDLARGGEAIVVAPDWIVGFARRAGGFVPLLEDYFLKSSPLRLVYPAAQFLPARTRALINFLTLAPGGGGS